MTLLELRDEINKELIRNPEKANLQMYYNTDYGVSSLGIGFDHAILYRIKTKSDEYEALIPVAESGEWFWENPNVEIIEECLIC